MGNPPDQQTIVVRVRVESFAAAMWQNGSAFNKQKAAFRRGRKKPAPARFLHQMLVIFGRFETKQGKLETILPAGLAVTATAVATVLRKYWDNLIGKVDGVRSSAFSTIKGIEADTPSVVLTPNVPRPLASGLMIPFLSTLAREAGEISKVTLRVKSLSFPESCRAVIKALMTRIGAAQVQLLVRVRIAVDLDLKCKTFSDEEAGACSAGMDFTSSRSMMAAPHKNQNPGRVAPKSFTEARVNFPLSVFDGFVIRPSPVPASAERHYPPGIADGRKGQGRSLSLTSMPRL